MSNCKYNTKMFFCMAIFMITILSLNSECHAIEVEALRAPMGALKTEVFGWMFAVKIAAVAVGGAFAVVKQSVVPFGIGAGITAGIHFFDKFIGDGAGAFI